MFCSPYIDAQNKSFAVWNFPPNPSAEQQDTDLVGQGDGGILSGDIGDPAVKVFAAGSQDGAVGPEAPVLH